MAHLGPKQLSATSAFVQSAGAKLLVIGLNAATGILSGARSCSNGPRRAERDDTVGIFLASVFSLGIPSALTYRLRRHPEQLSELSGAALMLSLVISAVACTVGFFGLPHWIPQYSPQVLFLRVFSS